MVPGGWAPEFGVQSIGGPAIAAGGFGFGGYGGAVTGFGYGVSPYGMGYGAYGGAIAPYGSAVVAPFAPTSAFGLVGGAPITVNALDPLANAIGVTVRTPRRR
jgi:hypothetical protein